MNVPHSFLIDTVKPVRVLVISSYVYLHEPGYNVSSVSNFPTWGKFWKREKVPLSAHKCPYYVNWNKGFPVWISDPVTQTTFTAWANMIKLFIINMLIIDIWAISLCFDGCHQNANHCTVNVHLVIPIAFASKANWDTEIWKYQPQFFTHKLSCRRLKKDKTKCRHQSYWKTVNHRQKCSPFVFIPKSMQHNWLWLNQCQSLAGSYI